MEVLFGDGVLAHVALGPLRQAYPCADFNAKCARGQLFALWIDRGESITITDAELSDARGLSLDWSNGHSTGIYAREMLRKFVHAGRLDTVD